MSQWEQWDAIRLCAEIERVCPKFGCHVALTGGLLYKDGPRKDLDILFYRIRQCPRIDMEGLWGALKPLGLEVISGFGWCYKAHIGNKPIDCFFPEEQNGIYDEVNAAESQEVLNV